MARIQIGDRVIEVDDSFLSLPPADQQKAVDEIENSLGQPQAQQPQAEAPGQTDVPPTPSLSRTAGLGARAIGRGVGADLLGMPGDIREVNDYLGTGAVNLGVGAINKGISPVFERLLANVGAPVDIPDVPEMPSGVISKAVGMLPAMGGPTSDEIAGAAEQIGQGLGIDLPTPETGGERIWSEVLRFASQAATGSAALAKAAAGRAAMDLPALLRAYTAPKVLRTAVGDTAGGAGAGAANSAVEEYFPDNPLAAFLATVLGAWGGSSATNAAMAPAKAVRAIEGRMPASRVFQDSKSIVPVSNRTVDQATKFVHENATDPKSALAQVMEAQKFYGEAGGAVPSTGLVTEDVGMQLLDRRMRDRNPQPFMERDTKVRNSAFNDVSSLRPENADPTLPRQVAEDEIASRLGSAEARRLTADQRLAAARESDAALGDQYAQPPMTAEEASAMLDKALIQETGMPRRGEKNRLFADIDPNEEVMVSTQPLVDLMKTMGAEQKGQLPSIGERVMPESSLVSDIKATEPRIDPKTGKNVGGTGKISFKKLNEMRPVLSEMESQAREGKQFIRAGSTGAIKKQIGKEAETLAASGSPAGERALEALKYYEKPYKPFREGPVGALMKDIARDPARDRTPPSATAKRLIVKGPGSPEAAANVNMALSRADLPQQNAGREAIKNHFLADMKNTVRDGVVQENRLQTWINNNRSTLDGYPGFKKEATDLLENVRSRKAGTTLLQRELTEAVSGQKATKREMEKSAFAIFAGKDPEKAIAKLLSSSTGDPVAAVKQMRAKFAGNAEADKGLKAAVGDYLIEQLKNSGKSGVSGDASPLSLAKIEGTFRRNGKLLDEVFGDDIKFLNRARVRLEALSRRSGQATPGTSTPERMGMDKLFRSAMKPVEIIAKLTFGQLAGGGYTRSARLMAEQFPDSTAAAEDLILRMSLDLDVAKHVLARSPKEIGTPLWNGELIRLMGWAAAGRASDANNQNADSVDQ